MTDAHDDFEGPIHVVGPLRDGWGFDCRCGYRSPLYQNREAATAAMHGHQLSPPVKRRARLLGARRGWPIERRHDVFAGRTPVTGLHASRRRARA